MYNKRRKTLEEAHENEIKRVEEMLSELRKNRQLNWHHDAIKGGYIAIGESYIEDYKGHFGTGYLVHWATYVKGRFKRNYHVCSYFVKPRYIE